MTVREATLKSFERCKIINNQFQTLCNPSVNNISWLIDKGIENIDTYPIDKLNRWLGYVQGYLIFNGVTSVDAERDFTRPLFHEAYKNKGIQIPDSIDVKE